MHDPLNVYRGRYREFIEDIMKERPLNEWFENSEHHHIVPRSIEGQNEEDNLIYLTYREHFIAHQILAEENPDIYKLTYAWNLMCNYRPEEVTPEEYEAVKSRFHHMLSTKMRGNTRGRKPRSKETRQRLSESKLGSNNPNYRKTPSEETRRKISESMKRYGCHTHTEETKRIIGIKSSARRFDKHCPICDMDFIARSNRTKYCDDCHEKYGSLVYYQV